MKGRRLTVQVSYRTCPPDTGVMPVLSPSFALASAGLSRAFVGRKGMEGRRECLRETVLLLTKRSPVSCQQHGTLTAYMYIFGCSAGLLNTTLTRP